MSTTENNSVVRQTIAGTVVMNPVLCDLRRQLESSPFSAIKKLHCDYREGVVILQGRVPTFHTRQVALALVMKVAGVDEIDDRIVVAGLAVGQQ